jgi:hypothetical protein
VRIVDRDAGTVEIEMPIPAVGLSPALSKLLRIAARADVVVSLASRLGARRHAHGSDNPLADAADSQQQRTLERLRRAGEQPVNAWRAARRRD